MKEGEEVCIEIKDDLTSTNPRVIRVCVAEITKLDLIGSSFLLPNTKPITDDE